MLDIGVFTGASSLAAALAMPSDGMVHALDISEEYVNLGKLRKLTLSLPKGLIIPVIYLSSNIQSNSLINNGN